MKMDEIPCSALSNALEIKAMHARNSYKCITRLIVTSTRHDFAAWVQSYTKFMHNMQDAPDEIHQQQSGVCLARVHAPVVGPSLSE